MTRDAAARSSRGTTHGPRRILFGCCRSPDEIPALIAHQCATAKRCALKNRQERECDPAITPTLCEKSGLDAYLNRAVAGVWHPVGSCRMGRADDPLAVTTPQGRVHGIAGLRVCDASVMPSIPCANTNIPTIMVAERMADLIKGESAA